jgi:DNA-binding CsgD family transcriptional regulator
VSTNTVRGHVRTLIRKLAATGRDDAVRHAREPELLSPPGPCTATPLLR